MSSRNTTGFFSRGINSGDFLGLDKDAYELPNTLALPVILIIHKVLQEAFIILREENYAIDTAKEDEVTVWLRNVVVNQLWQNGIVPGFNKNTFEKATRQQEIENYNGTKIRKTPDLVFCPKTSGNKKPILESHYGMFVECKPVGESHFAWSDYCKKGLFRFLNGDYAWSMKQGMMVGYARNGRTIDKHLLPVFKREHKPLDIISQLQVVNAEEQSFEPLLVSEHGREFSWPHNKGTACNIQIYHSWHCC